jgi:hypothetical protein
VKFKGDPHDRQGAGPGFIQGHGFSFQIGEAADVRIPADQDLKPFRVQAGNGFQRNLFSL